MLTIVIGVSSYSRMLWKVGNYNAMRHELETLKQHSRQLQTTVNDTNQRLDSLQSLATEVAMTYGVLRYHPVAFDVSDNSVTPEDAFDQSVEQYTFLKKNSAAIAGSSIKRGQVIGYCGISGRSTGPHVHYEVRMNNAPINPWRYMKATPAGD